MQAVVFRGIGDIRLEEVPDPRIEQPSDAIVRITTCAICGTDLHMVRGTMPGMKSGTILGHEGVGIVEEVGPQVRNLRPGDRVVIPSTICCGTCVYCRAGYSAQCDRANPKGPDAGTAFYGGPESSGPFHGLHAEGARIPFAAANLVKLPDELTDDQAIILSDIFPTGWFGAELAEIAPGDTVCIFGCGPVGQLAIASAFLMEAGRVFAVDSVPSRLDVACSQGAEVIDFESEDPVEVLRELTQGVGPDRVIDAVGIDAVHPHRGPAAEQARQHEAEFEQELASVASSGLPTGSNWRPGDGPSQVLRWAVKSVAKAGTVSIVGVYPPGTAGFPIGLAAGRNLTVKMGNCSHRRYIPHLMQLVRGGVLDPSEVITRHEPLSSAIDAFEAFDRREAGWLKVELTVAM